MESSGVGATASRSTRFLMDDLRKLASGLASGLGVPPSRASSLATHLLWFDAAGASSHGIATLPQLLERIERKEIDPLAEGRAGTERAGTAVFDARHGVALLALESAAGIASEKARDVGLGLVRVRHLGPSGPASPIVAELAIGPFVAMIAGPGPSFTMALPSPHGLPFVFDTALVEESEQGEESTRSIKVCLDAWAPWIASTAGTDDWLILALSASALEPLSSFHDRVRSVFNGLEKSPGSLQPESWEASRRDARERGIAIDPALAERLKIWSERFQVPWPSGLSG